MLFLALKKVSPPSEKIPVLSKICNPCPLTGRGDFSPTPLMLFEKSDMFHLSKTRCRNNFQIIHSLTVNCDSV